MSSLPLWAYGVILVGALALSLVFTPVALATALRMHIFDHPGPQKAHSKAVPYLGGAAIVVSFAMVTLVATVLRPPPSGLLQLAGFMGLALLLALVGLVDDLLGGLNPWLRLALEAAAGLAVWSMGYAAHLPYVPGAVDAVVTVVWVAGVTNAFNLLDNMDGLSAGVTVMATLSIFGIAWAQQRYLVAALAIALAGCAAGFLRHNFHPARIYMGDAGSLFLGFMVAVLLLKLRASAPTRVEMAVVLAVPGVALLDTTLVMAARVAHRRSPFLGGQDHTSHRLVHLGLSVRQAVVLTYAVGALLGGVALVMLELGPNARIVGVVGLLVAATATAAILYRAPVYRVPWSEAKGRQKARKEKPAPAEDCGPAPTLPNPRSFTAR